MPLVKTLTTTAICDFCPAAIIHVAGTHSPLALEYFFARHWTILDSPTAKGHTTIACPRCTPILDTITGAINAGLDRAAS